MSELMWVVYSGGYLLVAIAFLFLSKLFFNLVTSYCLDDHLAEKDNPAVGIVLTGFLVGVAAIICSIFAGDAPEKPTLDLFLGEIVPVFQYGLIGLVFLFIAGLINDKIVLREFSTQKEIVENHNSAVASVVGATYIGSGLIIAGGIYGSINMLSALIAFGVGQVALVIFAYLYQKLTKYDDQEELSKKKNVSAGIAFSGTLIAYSLILMKGVCVTSSHIDEWDWNDRLLNILYYSIAGCVLLVITRFVNDYLFFPKSKISKEIVVDQNFNAGLLEAGLALAMGAAMVFCL